MPVRLGRAGGLLVLHMPINANRELGIILFLSNVGLLSGGSFVETVFSSQGGQWVLLGALVTVLPLLGVVALARKVHGLNFMPLCGLLSGGMTDPPALALADSLARSDSPAVAYAAVYPLTMILRIVAAQILAQLG